MEALCPSLTTIYFGSKFPLNPHKSLPQIAFLNTDSHRFPISLLKHETKNHSNLSLSSFISPICYSTTQITTSASDSSTTGNNHWMVLMARPPQGVNSKPQIIDYYVSTLQRVLGSEKDAQMCIYDVSSDTHFGFCCHIDEQASYELARLPEVLSVKPDPDYISNKKDYASSNMFNSGVGSLRLFPSGNTKHWLVRMEKPGVEVVTKAQMVDYYTQILTKVLGNEKDAQMCIYHVSWQFNFGFCCELDEECARELSGVPGVLSVELDRNFESDNKDYGGPTDLPENSEAREMTTMKTKKLFITGLSFYTSEKTLRSHFEGFGELVEVKIIMDKISKRSKGYAFVEYTTEEAAAAALKEMNGKIINGWMIVVDVAKTRPSNFSRGRPRPTA